jgi:hypothetical protein
MVTSLLAACAAPATEPSASGTATTTALDATVTPTPTPTPTPTAGASGPVSAIPDETAGPFPADGSNGVNVLDDSGIVRSVPARRAGDRLDGQRPLHVDLPGVLLGAVAAHPLRGVLGCRERRGLGPHREDLADRAAAGGERRRLRHVGLRAERAERVAGSLARDNVFRDDGGIHQIATMSGSVASGYMAALTIGV